MFLAASVLGPVLGGLLTDYVHWSFIFWINVPLGTVALVMTDRALRKLPRHDRPHRLDILGAALMVAAAVVFLLALTWGGRRFPWASPETVARWSAARSAAMVCSSADRNIASMMPPMMVRTMAWSSGRSAISSGARENVRASNWVIRSRGEELAPEGGIASVRR